MDVSFDTNNWGGLEYNGQQSLLDGSYNSDNWFYAIGTLDAYDGGIPGPNGAVGQVELYVGTFF